MKPCIDFEGNNVCYTFTSPVVNGTHIIDHFLLSNGLFDHMLEYYSMHNGSNLSFHSPLVLTVNLDIKCHDKKCSSRLAIFWHNA